MASALSAVLLPAVVLTIATALRTRRGQPRSDATLIGIVGGAIEVDIDCEGGAVASCPHVDGATTVGASVQMEQGASSGVGSRKASQRTVAGAAGWIDDRSALQNLQVYLGCRVRGGAIR